MPQETRKCQNCKKEFVIEPDDFVMYEKLDLSSPEMCPACRWKYLLSFWTFGRFRIAKSALSGKTIITVLPESVSFPIYDRTEFVSDEWDPLTYGKDYDVDRSFIEQVVELQSKVPHPHQVGTKNINCDWTDDVWESKDVYLTRSALNLDSISYGYRVVNCKNCIDITYCFDLEKSYDCLYCFKSYNLKYSFDSRDCMDGSFLHDCRNCQNCFMCWNLRNQKYCILNKQYTKDEYEQKIKEYNLKSRNEIEKLKKEFWQYIKNNAIHRQDYNIKIVNSYGNFIINDKNCNQCYFLEESENCHNCFRGYHSKDVVDSVGVVECEKCAIVLQDQFGGYGNICNLATTSCRYSAYLDSCEECENCFGCIGLRNKSYCVLNKQYSKEEYENLVAKIKANMKEKGEWGKFWPLSSAYCGYNISLAQMNFPMTKDEAFQFGYKWDDMKEPQYDNVIDGNDLPDSADFVSDEITKQRILCPETKLSYNITKDELSFYKEQGIPLPNRHFDWRTLDRYKPFSYMINIQKGNCCFCKKEIEHYYSPELKFEKIACLDCYQQNII